MMRFVIDGKEIEAIFIINELSRMDHIRRHLLVPTINPDCSDVPVIPHENSAETEKACQRVAREIQRIRREANLKENSCLETGMVRKELCSEPCPIANRCRDTILSLTPYYEMAIREGLAPPPIPEGDDQGPGFWHLHCEKDNRVEVLAVGRGGIKVVMEPARTDYNLKTAYYPDTAPPNCPFASFFQAPGYHSNISEKDSQAERRRAAIHYLSSRESRSCIPCLKELFCNG